MCIEVEHVVTGKHYYIFNINFYMMGANPDIKFLLWDPYEETWLVDYSNSYKPVGDKFYLKAKLKGGAKND